VARSGSNHPSPAVVLVALALLAPVTADANVRFQSNRFASICRVVVTAESPRGSRVLYDGPVKRGDFKTFFGGDGTTLCVYRSSIPQDCRSRLTGPQCMTDRHSNRTILFSIQ